MIRIEDFQYDLPPELIATHPVDRRDGSRLMVLPQEGCEPPQHRLFSDLPGLLRPRDLLVLNASRVIPARLLLARPGGGVSELLLVREVEPATWEAIVRPARKLQPGARLELPEGLGAVTVTRSLTERTRLVRFESNFDVLALLDRLGHIPLPPYILRERKVRGEEPTDAPEDRIRYQTVYAGPPGSVAAPTAGLHFTPGLLDALERQGIERQTVTLHVGPGTFAPLTSENLAHRRLHEEFYEISPHAAEAIERARLDPGRRVVAVGTTTVRTLESCFAKFGAIRPSRGTTDLFIQPGFGFGVADALLTNFHLPGSSLLMLVAAFVGRERLLAAYREAVAQRYRFFSYGDAMLMERG